MVTVPEDSLEHHVATALHVGDEYNGIIREFRRAVRITGVQHVEYYDHGLPTVAVDLLEDPVLAAVFRGSRTVARARSDYETIGRQLNHRMTELNASLTGLAGGRLIRTVFAADDRAVLYFDVDNGQYIVGVCLTGDALETADRSLSETAARIRQARGMTDPNYGGYRGSGDTYRPAPPAGQASVDRPGETRAADAGGDAVHVFASLPRPSAPVFASPWASLIHRRWSSARDRREELFQAQAVNILQPIDLQYIALVRDGRMSAADVLDHSDLNEFFVGLGRSARRDAFEKVGVEFLALSDLLDGLLRSVLNRRLSRTVLDVEKGALYFHRLSRDEVLLGVTLDQRRVAHADQRFQQLVRRFTAAGG
ncbi:hypothetical protein [Frankia sp. QA3]|uniref:hypothetical protein n=1 Tax=Frankia sp. QA3 TaxID=710111 RepID=UPI000269BE7E|nr:hypothetical protein [Frankia sp. QA3]EIV93066.1 hypothetical protein FraQA3DRAFT_2742 [Frankia sp. QA3]